jgi:sulfur-oxidizing protein SoxA
MISPRAVRLAFVLLALAVAGDAIAQSHNVVAQSSDVILSGNPGAVPYPLKSGIDFMGAEVRALQQDDFANPGMLWVTRGEKLWQEPAGAERKSCASCHGDAQSNMRGVATRYPLLDPGTARLFNLESRIMQCRERHQRAAPFKYETDELLAITAYVRHQSRGMPVNVTVDWQNRKHFEAGRDMFYRRMGQLNLSCAQCHQENWGKQLGPESISQGHGNAYPIYRFEWQTVGSLHRRFRSCLSGVRAELLPYGAAEYFDLELYLAWRAGGLPVETPGVRR